MRFRPVCLLALLAVGMTTSNALADPPMAKKRALLIGINTYSVERLAERPIRYAVSDVVTMAELLKAAGWDVTLLTSKGAANSATRSNILAALDKAAAGMGADDTLLLVLSGHGRQFAPKDGAAEEIFFCPSDGHEKKAETLIGMAELLKHLGPAKGAKLVMIDAARIAPPTFKEPTSSEAGLDKKLTANTAILFGSAVGQHALETTLMYGKESLKGHGIFFYRVWKGLMGEAKSAQHEVTWAGLAEYVQKTVNEDAVKWYPELASKAPDGRKVIQTPHLMSNLTGAPPVLASAAVKPPK